MKSQFIYKCPLDLAMKKHEGKLYILPSKWQKTRGNA